MRSWTIVTGVALTAVFGASGAAAQAPTSGWRAEFLNSLGGAERKYVALAEATPWATHAWRPGQGVRSVCEVFLHISGANYMFAEPLGAKTPASVDLQNIEKCPAGRDQVVTTLKASFAHLRNAVVSASDASADAPVEIFGMKNDSARAAIVHGGAHGRASRSVDRVCSCEQDRTAVVGGRRGLTLAFGIGARSNSRSRMLVAQ